MTTKIGIGITIAILLGICLAFKPEIMMCMVLIIGTFLAIHMYKNPVSRVLAVAFGLRLLLMAVGQFIALPDSEGDARAFDYLAQQTVEAWKTGSDVFHLSGAYAFYVGMAAIYYVFGPVMLIPQILNVIFGTLIVLVVYKITKEMATHEGTPLRAAWICALLPTFQLYSAVLLRDMLMVLLASISFLYFIKWVKSGRDLNMLFAMLLLLGSSSFHGAMIAIGLVYMLYYCFYQPGKKRFYLIGPRLFIGMGLLVVGYAVFGTSIISKVPDTGASIDFVNQHLENYAVNRTAYLVGMSPGSWKDIILYTPIRSVYFLFAPFPWMISSASDLFGLLDSLIYVVFVITAWFGLKELKKVSPEIRYALIGMLLVEVVILAWGVSNYGTGIRHRLKIAWMIIPIASIGIANMKLARTKVYKFKIRLR